MKQDNSPDSIMAVVLMGLFIVFIVVTVWVLSTCGC